MLSYDNLCHVFLIVTSKVEQTNVFYLRCDLVELIRIKKVSEETLNLFDITEIHSIF